MKKPPVRLTVVVALVLFVCFLLAQPFARAQEQEDLSKKVQPQQKVVPNQPVAPKPGSVPQFKIGEFTVIVEVRPASPRDSGSFSSTTAGFWGSCAARLFGP